MDSSVILRFMIFTAALQILFDVYINVSWGRFVRRRGWNHWFSRGMWALSGFMLTASMLTMYRRLSAGALSEWDLAMQYAVWLWYVPKLPIVIALLIKDKFRLLRWAWRKIAVSIRRNISPRKQEQPPPAGDSSRRDFLQKAGWALAGAPFIVVADGMFRTLYDFRVENVTLGVKGLPGALEGLRIVQISDLHAGSFGSPRPMREVTQMIREQRCDVIVITGDFVNSRPDELPTIYRELELLKAPLGVFGCLGNHDHFMSPENHAILTAALRKTPLDLLVNENRIITVDGAKLAIAGTDNTGFNQHFARLDAALAGVEPDVPTILLAHDPTFWDKEVRGTTPIDVMLSGHTHGGQVAFSIPGMTVSAAQLVYKQWAGLYGEGGQLLYVNRGIGTVGPPLRIGVPPEITVFTLVRA